MEKEGNFRRGKYGVFLAKIKEKENEQMYANFSRIFFLTFFALYYTEGRGVYSSLRRLVCPWDSWVSNPVCLSIHGCSAIHSDWMVI